jgi:hypothetical protein
MKGGACVVGRELQGEGVSHGVDAVLSSCVPILSAAVWQGLVHGTPLEAVSHPNARGLFQSAVAFFRANLMFISWRTQPT